MLRTLHQDILRTLHPGMGRLLVSQEHMDRLHTKVDIHSGPTRADRPIFILSSGIVESSIHTYALRFVPLGSFGIHTHTGIWSLRRPVSRGRISLMILAATLSTRLSGTRT